MSVDVIFPPGAVHLVAGPTGAGKTRWLLEAMIECAYSRPVLGYPSHAEPWLYVSADRQESEVWDTVDALGLNHADIPLFPAFAPIKSVSMVFDAAEAQNRSLLVWEGFGSYVGDRAGSVAVRQWLSAIVRMLRYNKHGAERPLPLTIIGVMEQPKMKPRDQYQNPRQRVSGPAAWGHSASTIVLIEYANKQCRGPLRTVAVYPRNGPDFNQAATLATGHFVILP